MNSETKIHLGAIAVRCSKGCSKLDIEKEKHESVIFTQFLRMSADYIEKHRSAEIVRDFCGPSVFFKPVSFGRAPR